MALSPADSWANRHQICGPPLLWKKKKSSSSFDETPGNGGFGSSSGSVCQKKAKL
jgi:hypothetical protein